MSEERIAALEQDLARLRAGLAEDCRLAAEETRFHNDQAGNRRAFQAAVFALIESHPDPAKLEERLAWHLARVDAGIVATSESDELLSGYQNAQELLLVALRIASNHGK